MACGRQFKSTWAAYHELARLRFGIEVVPFDGTVRPLEPQMAGDAALWREIAIREGLAEPDLIRLASPWHTDADLGQPAEVVADKKRPAAWFHRIPTHRRCALRPVQATRR